MQFTVELFRSSKIYMFIIITIDVINRYLSHNIVAIQQLTGIALLINGFVEESTYIIYSNNCRVYSDIRVVGCAQRCEFEHSYSYTAVVLTTQIYPMSTWVILLVSS
jgi:hypothetical protein